MNGQNRRRFSAAAEKNAAVTIVIIFFVCAAAAIAATPVPAARAAMMMLQVGSTAAAGASGSAAGVAAAIVGTPVRVDLLLDTQGGDINAVAGSVVFPADRFTLQKITDGNSLVSLWITPPSASAAGTVSFAGITPGGYAGTGPMFSLWLIPRAPGSGVISLEQPQALQNDGKGTPAPVATSSLAIDISPAPSSTSSGVGLRPPSLSQTSLTPPEPFTPVISRDPNLFGGKYFLSFAAVDTGSGIDHYEVMEVPTGPAAGNVPVWRPATSPYLLTDQSLSSDIYVRAVDHDGNFIVVEVPAEHPQEASGWTQRIFLIAAEWIIGLLLLAVVWRILLRYLRRRSN